jgi:hypothetical protein
MKRMMFVSLLLIALPLGDHLEGRGQGRMGAARGFGGLAHPGGKALGFSVRGHFASGYGIHGFTRPGFRSGQAYHNQRFRYPSFGFGYYAPFYGSYFSSGIYGVSFLPLFEYYDNNDFQLYPSLPNTTQPNPKTDCKDSWIVQRHASTLESVIRSAFQQQCQNAHPAAEVTPVEHQVD